MRCSLIIALLLLLLAPAHAATPPVADNALPVDISSDTSLEWDQTSRTYTARGNAVAKRGTVTIAADILVAHERDNADTKKAEVWKLTAEGNVRITNAPASDGGQPTDIYGERGVYDIDRQVAVLTGNNLKLVSGNDTITAQDRFEYWQQQNLAVAVGNAEAVRTNAAGGKAAERHIKADKMTALFKEDAQGNLEAQRMEANGNVTIITATDVATGDKAVYDLAKNKAQLAGDVNLTRGKNQLAGARAEVDFKTGLSRLLAADAKKPEGRAGDRVRGIIYPRAAGGSQ
jgi:lipopolysaccharide export system protein LptA